MAGKCTDGVELPDYGACPVCGAQDWEQCRTQAYAAYMKARSLTDRKPSAEDIKRIVNTDRRRA